MIVPLKVVICFLKSVEQFPGVQNDYLVLNTPGSLDSTVVNTLLGVFGTTIRTALLKKTSGDK
jgi:hypothetical protein